MTLVMALGRFLMAIASGIILSRNISRPIQRIAEMTCEGAAQIAPASTQVSTASQEVAQGSQKQAASIEETGAALEEHAAMTKQNADNSRTVAKLMAETNALVEKSAGGTVAMDSAMKEIKGASDQTSKIIKTIDEIAFQTNLLALNQSLKFSGGGGRRFGRASQGH
jgi:methyl-accepting chemotaxis protein